MSEREISLKVRVWRQAAAGRPGSFEDHSVSGVSTGLSFLEMMDMLNEQILTSGGEPITFESDCREGICGACGFMINGQAHGPERGTTVCQLHMRHFQDGDLLILEPWRAEAMPVEKDLMVDRSSFDRIQQAGGYTSVNCGNAPEANSMLVGKDDADLSMANAACIGCGACVASCVNASANLFVGAKISQFALLPQGQPERKRRALRMVGKMVAEGFGSCSNTLECEAACPKEISVESIARMNREFVGAALSYEER